MLPEILYEDRAAVDYFDKQLSILSAGDWKYFSRTMRRFQEYFAGREDISSAFAIIRRALLHRDFLGSRDLSLDQKVDWPWAPTKLSRAALEGLYFCGELAIHHKEGNLKYYAPAERLLPHDILQQQDPFSSEQEFLTWRVFRRIGAVGLLWNADSDAFLGIDGLKAAQREQAFQTLVWSEQILPIRVEGIGKPLYLQKSDLPFLEEACSNKYFRHRTELIAPLDCLMWDRKLIQALFGFTYRWEIYTPVSLRQFGYYVLPILDGVRLAGRLGLSATGRKRRCLSKISGGSRKFGNPSDCVCPCTIVWNG